MDSVENTSVHSSAQVNAGVLRLRGILSLHSEMRRPLRVTFFLTGVPSTAFNSLLGAAHSLRMQRLQRLHSHFSPLQRGDAFGGGAGG
jgi:hypothetical protein